MAVRTIALTILVLSPAFAVAEEASGLAGRSRTFFEPRIDFALEKDLLVVKTDPKGGLDRSAVYQAARTAFPNVSRLSVRVQSGSSSSSRGGTGNVTLEFEPNSNAGHFNFSIDTGTGEAVTLAQRGPGELTLKLKKGRRSAEYTQSQGRCKLKIRAGIDSLSASGKTFSSVINENPDVVRKHFLDVLESYFDKLPVIRLPGAPPGKVLLYLKDQALVVGEMKTASLTLHTDYGTLQLPRAEIRRIVFPASPTYKEAGGGNTETVVVMTRFVPKGRLELDAFEMKTKYGDLRIDRSVVLHAVFGPPLESSDDSKTEPIEASGGEDDGGTG